MSKLVKDLKTGDTVYAVERAPGRRDLCNKIIECKISIEFNEDTFAFGEYKFKKFHGYLDSGNAKFWHGFKGQVIRTSTVSCTDESKKISTKSFNAYSDKPCGVKPDVYTEILNSESFSILSTIIVFTSKEAAQNYIIDSKLEDIRKELRKSIRTIKYKENKDE